MHYNNFKANKNEKDNEVTVINNETTERLPNTLCSDNLYDQINKPSTTVTLPLNTSTEYGSPMSLTERSRTTKKSRTTKRKTKRTSSTNTSTTSTTNNEVYTYICSYVCRI